MIKIAIDVGGTFTDCLVLDEAGRLHQFKSPTTPEDPEKVRRDVINGFISIAKARDAYKVAIDPESLAVDKQKTEALRSEKG